MKIEWFNIPRNSVTVSMSIDELAAITHVVGQTCFVEPVPVDGLMVPIYEVGSQFFEENTSGGIEGHLKRMEGGDQP